MIRHTRYRGGFLIALVILMLLIVVTWVNRGALRDYWEARSRPHVPVAQPFAPRTGISSTSPDPVVTSSVVGISAVNTLPETVVPPVDVPIDPFADNGPLPSQVNLAVPFLAQAPKQNWNMPYQEACEEASMIMVNAFYQGRTTPFSAEEGDKAILDLVAFEEARGLKPDLTAAEVMETMNRKWEFDTVLTRIPVTVDSIKRALANGYPVIIPVDGKALKNPRFRNGGPLYHMLVIKGYVGDQYWITNDPGTKFGADFTYPIDHLVSVAHDWNGGDVPRGVPVIVVATPRVQ